MLSLVGNGKNIWAEEKKKTFESWPGAWACKGLIRAKNLYFHFRMLVNVQLCTLSGIHFGGKEQRNSIINGLFVCIS
jgi:hypothetical protein